LKKPACVRFSGKAGAGGLCADYHGQGEINRYETGLERKNEKMNISRKDFFKKSLLSLGEVVCSVSDVLKPSAEPTLALPDIADFVAVPRMTNWPLPIMNIVWQKTAVALPAWSVAIPGPSG
jgi:hypothetical protein